MSPQPVEPSPRVSATYRIDSRLERNIRTSFQSRQALFTHNLNQEGVHLFQEKTPGRVFNLGNGRYHYNTGTAVDGSYVPPFTYQNGRMTYHRLMDYDPSAKPSNPQEHSQRAAQQLDLIDNGKGIYRRRGFVGTYTIRTDGGIEFSGGHHESNPNIRFERQIYYNGYWYRLPKATGGFAPGRRSDTFTSPQATPISITSHQALQDKSRIPVRFGTGQSASTLTSTDHMNSFITRGGKWYSVMDPDEQHPYRLLNEHVGRIYYLVPDSERGHSPQVVPQDDGSGHPTELQPLIQNVRRYYEESRDYIASARGERPGGRLPTRSGIPRGFPLLPGGGETQLSSTYPNYAFINRPDLQGRPGVYYRHVDEPPTFWRSMMTDGNRWFRLQGKRMAEVAR